MEVATYFLDVLQVAADEAAHAETLFRSQAAERLKILERERAFAYRRMNLMRRLTEAAAQADDSETMAGLMVASLRISLGWAEDSEARAVVLSRFASVVDALCALLSLQGESSKMETVSAHVASELAAFEEWYADAHPVPFWTLFETYIPETCLVDF